jgi:hypothetical protein
MQIKKEGFLFLRHAFLLGIAYIPKRAKSIARIAHQIGSLIGPSEIVVS